MGSLKTHLSVGAIALLIGVPALGADMALLPPPPVLAEDAPAPLAELGTGWYIRGDVGYADYGKVEDAPYGPRAADPVPPPPLDHEKIGKIWIAGGGAGYQFNNWFRMDGTIDYRGEAKFRATSSATNYVHGFSTDEAKIESTTYLVNGYIDLGNWSGFTPYVGAGIGLAQNHIKDYVGLGVLYPTHPAYPAGATGNFLMDPAPLPSKTTYNLAWAVMAGVAVDIGYGFKLDAGYRYAHLGDVKTGYEFGIGTKLKALDAHEARIGVRYMID